MNEKLHMNEPKPLEQKLRQALRETEQNLPDGLESRLADIRQAALAEAEPSRSQHLFTWPGFAVGMATVVVVALLFAPTFNSDNSSTFDNSTALASAEEDIDKDLEFYQWLLETDAMETLSE